MGTYILVSFNTSGTIHSPILIRLSIQYTPKVIISEEAAEFDINFCKKLS